jgi:biopolymer transport protein ExbD
MAIDYADHADLENLDLSAGINITPLIDVLLVLLVMLIITIPIQLHAVNMELPAGAPPMQTAQPLVVRLDVGADNQIAWDGQPLADRAMLYARLQAAAAWPVPPEIHVRAHANAKYDTVAAVLSAAQRMGLEKIGVVGLEAYGR